MAVALVRAANFVLPDEMFPVDIHFDALFIRGGKFTTGCWGVYGYVWHIVGGEHYERWSNGAPVPLCSGFVGWSGRTAQPATNIKFRWDRVCKTCVKVAESRARKRGVH